MCSICRLCFVLIDSVLFSLLCVWTYVKSFFSVWYFWHSLWWHYMRNTRHVKQKCSGALSSSVAFLWRKWTHENVILWRKTVPLDLTPAPRCRHLMDSTWTFLPKQWLLDEALHLKNVAYVSLIVTTNTDCTACLTTPRSCTYILCVAFPSFFFKPLIAHIVKATSYCWRKNH